MPKIAKINRSIDANVRVSYCDSPAGLLEIQTTEGGLRALNFVDEPAFAPVETALNALVASQLREYFDGQRRQFDVPLDVEGTDFQKKVWHELLKIPFGKTRSYMDIAKALGDVKTIRAVGLANGSNKIAIIIPCHRVIGSDGSLVGYAGGLHRKKWLLDFEIPPIQTALF